MRKRGFTLVELLMVIAVIGLLLALSLAAMRACREQAKSAVCCSNIRQLVFAFHGYCAVNETFPPGFSPSHITPPGGQVGNLSMNSPGWWWFNYLRDQIHDRHTNRPAIINCPSKRLNDPKLQKNVLCGNYGANESISKYSWGPPSREEFVGKPLSLDKIARPGDTLLLVDAGFALVNWWHATANPPQPLKPGFLQDTYIPGLKINAARQVRPGQVDDAMEGRHSGRSVNIGFVDGHALSKKSDYVLVEKSDDHCRNVRPLWKPQPR
jgi:prepilin-type N-terminal cleavage/methylation domain-containing protein/prepilin-type processing-associated H-X9-DG protein